MDAGQDQIPTDNAIYEHYDHLAAAAVAGQLESNHLDESGNHTSVAKEISVSQYVNGSIAESCNMAATSAAVSALPMQEPMQEMNPNSLEQGFTESSKSSIKSQRTRKSMKSTKQDRLDSKRSSQAPKHRRSTTSTRSTSTKGKTMENIPQTVQQEDGSSETQPSSYWAPAQNLVSRFRPSQKPAPGPSFQRLNKISEDLGGSLPTNAPAPTDLPEPLTSQPAEATTPEKKRVSKRRRVKGACQVRTSLERFYPGSYLLESA